MDGVEHQVLVVTQVRLELLVGLEQAASVDTQV